MSSPPKQSGVPADTHRGSFPTGKELPPLAPAPPLLALALRHVPVAQKRFPRGSACKNTNMGLWLRQAQTWDSTMRSLAPVAVLGA
jgi:hypothetical protein